MKLKLLAGPIDIGELKGLGPLGNDKGTFSSATDPTNATRAFSNFISLVITVMTVVSFIWFLFVIMTAAIGWLSSGGDKNKLQQAQKQITNGIIGLVIVISAIFFVKLIEIVLGINILRFAVIIQNL